VAYVICAAVAMGLGLSLFTLNYARVRRKIQDAEYIESCAAENKVPEPPAWRIVVEGNRVAEASSASPWGEGEDLKDAFDSSGNSIVERMRRRAATGGGTLELDVARDGTLTTYLCFATRDLRSNPGSMPNSKRVLMVGLPA
jgi:hypothetical protein